MTADLAARIEAGPGSRELSDAVLLAAGWKRWQKMEFCWRSPNEQLGWIRDGQQPDPTRSERDAIALLPERCECRLLIVPGDKTCVWLDIFRLTDNRPASVLTSTSGEAATPALALSAALVRARMINAPAP